MLWMLTLICLILQASGFADDISDETETYYSCNGWPERLCLKSGHHEDPINDIDETMFYCNENYTPNCRISVNSTDPETFCTGLNSFSHYNANIKRCQVEALEATDEMIQEAIDAGLIDIDVDTF